LQHILRKLADALGDTLAMRRLKRKGFEDQEAEGGLFQVSGFSHAGVLLSIR